MNEEKKYSFSDLIKKVSSTLAELFDKHLHISNRIIVFGMRQKGMKKIYDKDFGDNALQLQGHISLGEAYRIMFMGHLKAKNMMSVIKDSLDRDVNAGFIKFIYTNPEGRDPSISFILNTDKWIESGRIYKIEELLQGAIQVTGREEERLVIKPKSIKDEEEISPEKKKQMMEELIKSIEEGKKKLEEEETKE